jgi:hypothetical protein
MPPEYYPCLATICINKKKEKERRRVSLPSVLRLAMRGQGCQLREQIYYQIYPVLKILRLLPLARCGDTACQAFRPAQLGVC